jgi:tRNA threonylcarbamoyladenosine biosynthesis protein TsaE
MKDSLEVALETEADTIKLGERLSRCLAGRGRVYLQGGLGAGKTTLCRGILRAMGHKGAVKSPTFTLVEPYNINGGQVFHFDLYRLSDPDELEYIGVDDYFDGQGLCLVEWPEKAINTLPVSDLDVKLLTDGSSRRAGITACSAFGSEVLENLKQSLSG